MITAEHSSAVQIIDDKHSSGSLRGDIGTFYNEFHIINGLNEPLYAVDYDNHKILIPRRVENTYGADRRVEIVSRVVEGKRTFDSLRGYENTPNSHLRTIRIPYDLLRDEPIFVHEINAVLCFAHHLPFIKHPHSKDAKAKEMEDYREKINSNMMVVPMILNANDPAGRFRTLYIEINGIICAAQVTNIVAEKDYVDLAFRDKSYSLTELTHFRTTITELLEQDPQIWSLGGFRLSGDREWLEQVIEVERSKQPTRIDVATVNAMLKQNREEDEQRISQLIDEAKETKRQLTILKTNHEALKNNDYHERNAQLAHDKLKLEELKLQQAALDAEVNLKAERLKFRKELLTTFGVVAKTAAVVTPLAFGLYKTIQAMRSS